MSPANGDGVTICTGADDDDEPKSIVTNVEEDPLPSAFKPTLAIGAEMRSKHELKTKVAAVATEQEMESVLWSRSDGIDPCAVLSRSFDLASPGSHATHV